MHAVLSIVLLGTIDAQPTVNGLYPLWENTGELHARWSGQIGFAHAQLGFGPMQVGTQPFLDAYGTYNGELKVALWRGTLLRVAAIAGWYRVPAAAESRTIGNLHTVHLWNPYGPITLLPGSIAGTLLASRRLRVHLATTVLGQWAEDSRDRQVSVGFASIGELRASTHWAALLHAGVEGVPVTTQVHAGLSFAYRLPYLDLRIGYARRFEDGESSGVFLFDGALVF